MRNYVNIVLKLNIPQLTLTTKNYIITVLYYYSSSRNPAPGQVRCILAEKAATEGAAPTHGHPCLAAPTLGERQ